MDKKFNNFLSTGTKANCTISLVLAILAMASLPLNIILGQYSIMISAILWFIALVNYIKGGKAAVVKFKVLGRVLTIISGLSIIGFSIFTVVSAAMRIFG